MMTLAELERAVAIVGRELAGARVDRVTQSGDARVVLSLYAGTRGERQLLLCAEPRSARLSLVATRPAAPPAPPAFAQLLRARLAGARVANTRIVDADRQVALRFDGDAGAHDLLLSLLGPRSNLYLLDAQGCIAGALRPLGETRRDLALGGPWKSPPSKPDMSRGEDRFAAASDDAFFDALEALASEREEQGEQESLARRLEKALRRAAQATEKKLELLRGDAASADEVESLRRQGELLKSALGGVARGAREVHARDFATGEEVVIPLDPTLSPRRNLETLFTRARKAEKRAERALRETGEAEARRDEIGALAASFAAIAANDADALAAFAARPEVVRLLGRFAPEPAGAAPAPGRPAAPPRRVWKLGKTEVPARLTPRVYKTSTGLEIWVGRSDEGNDLLSTRLARGNDLFFHLDASPGSHVVLRTEGRSDPPSEAILEAAELAVHFSKHRKVTEAHVLVAPIKGVSKPRGVKPGLVYVTGGRPLRLRRDPRRLERVLATVAGNEPEPSSS